MFIMYENAEGRGNAFMEYVEIPGVFLTKLRFCAMMIPMGNAGNSVICPLLVYGNGRWNGCADRRILAI